MSFFSSITQFVNDAGSTLQESARKLVTTTSRETDPEDDYSSPSRLHLPLSARNSLSTSVSPVISRKNSRYGPTCAALTVPGMEGSCLSGVSPIPSPARSRRGSYNPPSSNQVLNSALLNASVSPGNGAGSICGTISRRSSSFHGRDRKRRKETEIVISRERKKSIQKLVEKQRPKIQPKLCPTYIDVPEKWDEHQTIETGVSDIDNGFLELYAGLLSDHQKRKRAYCIKGMARSSHAKDGPPSEQSLGIDPAVEMITDEERRSLYREVLYTINHKIGSSRTRDLSPMRLKSDYGGFNQCPQNANAIKDNLMSFAQKAFRITREEHQKLVEEAKSDKPPLIVLNVVVIEAKDLEAKDSDGFSDPYCMLGIRPGVKHLTAARTSSSPQYSPKMSRHEVRRSSADYQPDGLSSPLLGSNGRRSPANNSGSNSPGGRDPVNVEVNGENKDEVSALPEAFHSRLDKPRRSFRLSFRRRESSKKKKSESNTGTNGGDATTNPSSNTLGANLVTNSPGGLLPAKFIKATTVKSNTLSPHWNERFRLDHDDETSVLDAVGRLNEVKGMRGLGRYFKQVAQSARSGGEDDFLGSVNFPVRDIPSAGVEQWYKLEGRSTKSNIQGYLRLKLWLSTRENRGLSEEEDLWNEIRQHEQIYSVFLDHQVHHLKYPWEWDGELPEAACTILHQHMIQGDLTELQVAGLRWRSLFNQAKKAQINYKILYETLRTLDKRWDKDLLTESEEQSLAKSFNEFIDFGLVLIQNHRQLFPAENAPAQIKLEYLLRCFYEITDMRVSSRSCPKYPDLRIAIIASLQRGTVDLILRIPYIITIYKQYDKLAADSEMIAKELVRQFQPPISRRGSCQNGEFQSCQSPPAFGTKSNSGHLLGYYLFEICLALKDFYDLREPLLPPQDRSALIMKPSFRDWFVTVLHVWLKIVLEKLPQRVERSLETEQPIVDPDNLEVVHSSSAHDFTSSVALLKEFWRIFNWGELTNPRPHLAILIDAMCQSSTLYTDLSHKVLLEETKGEKGFYAEGSTTNSLQLAEKVVITLNNLEHILQYICLIPKELNFEEDTKGSMDSNDSDNFEEERLSCSLGDQGGFLADLIATACDYTDIVIYTVLETLQGKLEDGLRKHIFHLAWSPESLPTMDAIAPLMAYLDKHIQALNAKFLRGNYIRCLHVVWESVLAELREHSDASTGEKMPMFFDRLHEALQILSEFFYADGAGLSEGKLYTDNFNELDIQFSLNGKTTDQLIDKFHLERLDLQQRIQFDTPLYGILTVRVYFNHDSLFVEILKARDVIPLDSNGLSDPFVVIELLPQRIFNCHEQQTNIQKATLNPTFDECFEFPASTYQCVEPHAMLRFTIFDHDILSYNDFAGEAYLSLNTIPGINCDKSQWGSFHGLKQIHLPLMLQDRKDHPILKTLEARGSGDKLAIDFLKNQKSRAVN
ncbi:hypothetical protein TCAL_10740 [Tigriopus californicus]|uniref:BAI1-associated protein 3 n=1 Tax=Tigriopus californicus TaxID=6832 RepID=A0A553NTH3_TIGCA|nr:hypothetical protein TCAL_10740 [Tigriopus californicus]